MPKKAPRPRLRDGIGEARRPGHGLEDGRLVDLLEYDPPYKLNARAQQQWRQFAADPMPWWSDADLPTIAQYCVAVGKLTPSLPVTGWAQISREIRQLADVLGLTPMARARLKLGKGPVGGSGPGAGDGQDDGEGAPAEVIPIGSLVDEDGTPK